MTAEPQVETGSFLAMVKSAGVRSERGFVSFLPVEEQLESGFRILAAMEAQPRTGTSLTIWPS